MSQLLTSLSQKEIRSLKFILFDLDDTLLTDGALTHEAYNALCALAESGLGLFIVTGRPAAWGEILAYQWPIRGVVAENGGVVLWREQGRVYRAIAATQSLPILYQKLDDLTAYIHNELPELPLVDDAYLRLTDRTFDIGQHWKAPTTLVQRAQKIIFDQGAYSTISSIHLHLSYLSDTKSSGALRLLQLREGLDPAEARVKCAFLGDSLNDASCFSFFRTTIGVANIQPYLPNLSLGPRYVTYRKYGEGFTECARWLLQGLNDNHTTAF